MGYQVGLKPIGCSMVSLNPWIMEMKSHVKLGFTWCNPNCNTLYKFHVLHQNRPLRHTSEGQPISKCSSFLSKLFQVHLVLCETFEASHLRCQAHKVFKESKLLQGMFSCLLLCLKVPHVCQIGYEPWKNKFSCIIHKTQIQGFQGCMYTLEVLECSKTLQYDV